MDSMKSLSAPIKQFTSCMTGTTNNKKRGAKKSQSVRRNSVVRRNSFGRRNSFAPRNSRRKSIERRRSVPCVTPKVTDSWLRVYQADLQKERKRQQAKFAKKSAERAVRRTHFRSQHCLPRQAPIAKKPAGKDDSFFGAFQGLSLDGLTGTTQASPISVTSATGGDPCKVM